MKNLLTVLALALSTATVSFAGDKPDVPAQPNENHHGSLHYSCRMDANMRGLKLGFGPSAQYMSGRGEIHCVDMRHGVAREVRVPVKIRIIGAGVGVDFTIVRGVRMTSGGLGYVHSPMDLVGSFSVGKSAGVTFINRGVSVNSSISVKHHAKGLSYELGFMGERAYGLGARLHGTVMTVRALHADEMGDDSDEDSQK